MQKLKTMRLLCIDDEPDIETVCNSLADRALKIDVRQPHANWGQQISEIHDSLSKDGFQGLLIDFRLDELHSGKQTKDDQKEVVCYTAEALVSELRRRSV